MKKDRMISDAECLNQKHQQSPDMTVLPDPSKRSLLLREYFLNASLIALLKQAGEQRARLRRAAENQLLN